MLAPDLREKLGGELYEMALTIREVLFSADANRLAADLTQVRINDLFAPMPQASWTALIEPMVCFVIFLNGVLIGIETDADMQEWTGWFWVDVFFTAFYSGEMLIKMCVSGCRRHWLGSDRWWNLLDLGIVAAALLDTCTQTFSTNLQLSSNQLMLVRVIRLTRISRLFRLFHFRQLKELRLMLNGLFTGLRTLFWAVVLLLFSIYVVAIFVTTTIGSAADHIFDHEELFSSVPRSMYTIFRCIRHECLSLDGTPIVEKLAEAFGWLFVVGYLCVVVFIDLGLFNLIMAIYVECTIHSAKKQKEGPLDENSHEALRVAHRTKQLLKKFSAAHRICNEQEGKAEAKNILRGTTSDDLGEAQMTVTKELFNVVLADPAVQRIMDELDIPPEREALFDVFDVDGSGTMPLVSLMKGLLSVRGDAQKAAIIASQLGLRATHSLVRQMRALLLRSLEGIERLQPPESAPLKTQLLHTGSFMPSMSFT